MGYLIHWKIPATDDALLLKWKVSENDPIYD